MMTACRPNERYGTARTGRQRCRMARMTGPINTLPLASRGTVPGAAARPRAARTCLRHRRAH